MHHSDITVNLPIVSAINTLPKTGEQKPTVQFMQLDFYEHLAEIPGKEELYRQIETFIDSLNNESVTVLLTSPAFALDFSSSIHSDIHLKLWVTVKLETPQNRLGNILENHGALLFFTKSHSQLKHTKTRIGYAYCNTCNKTVKDYGGKKHLYNSFGTLISDVWRDIEYNPHIYPLEIIQRVADLFSTGDFQELSYSDLRHATARIIQNPEFLPGEINFNEGELNTQMLLGDCLQHLRVIPSNSVSFCFADPPYNLKKKYESCDDGLDIQQYFNWCDEWIAELARVVKPGHSVAILNIPQWCVRHFKQAKYVLDYQDWIAWEGLSVPVRMIMPAHYGILILSKGNPRALPGLIHSERNAETKSLYSFGDKYCVRPACIKKRKENNIPDTDFVTNLWWDVHRLKHNSKRVDHPCQLPPIFMYRLISLFTKENEVVLDPFDGAGTTSLCAHQLNRKYIGIELSEYYHNIAQQRHNDIVNGIDPFRKNNDDGPKAKNSYVARLKKQKYQVSKKVLQMDVKRISEQIGHIPSKQEVEVLSQYPIEYFTNYFINWAEVTAAARATGMQEDKISNEEFTN